MEIKKETAYFDLHQNSALGKLIFFALYQLID